MPPLPKYDHWPLIQKDWRTERAELQLSTVSKQLQFKAYSGSCSHNDVQKWTHRRLKNVRSPPLCNNSQRHDTKVKKGTLELTRECSGRRSLLNGKPSRSSSKGRTLYSATRFSVKVKASSNRLKTGYVTSLYQCPSKLKFRINSHDPREPIATSLLHEILEQRIQSVYSLMKKVTEAVSTLFRSAVKVLTFLDISPRPIRTQKKISNNYSQPSAPENEKQTSFNVNHS